MFRNEVSPSCWLNQPTHLNNMRPSNWIISPNFRDENSRNVWNHLVTLRCSHEREGKTSEKPCFWNVSESRLMPMKIERALFVTNIPPGKMASHSHVLVYAPYKSPPFGSGDRHSLQCIYSIFQKIVKWYQIEQRSKHDISLYWSVFSLACNNTPYIPI